MKTLRTFRIDEESDILMDALARYHGISRTDVVRMAVRELARSTMPEVRRRARKVTRG